MDPVPSEVHWDVSRDDEFNELGQTGDVLAASNLAHTVYVDVTGRGPAREYFYRFMAGGDTSPV